MQLIELWETFLMQLDADEEDEPFFKPAVAQTEPLIPKAQREEQQRQQQKQNEHDSQQTSEQQDGERHSETETAATATIEQEE